MGRSWFGSRVALIATSAAVFSSSAGLADSVGVYGVARIPVWAKPIDGRPLTYSDRDIFACVSGRPGSRIVRVPYTYVSDQTSIPNKLLIGPAFSSLLWGGFNPSFADGAIVHDYLYAAGTPGHTEDQRAADEALIALLAAQDVNDQTLKWIGNVFSGVRKSKGGQNSFGRPSEWTERWVDPRKQRLINVGHPPREAARPVVMTLNSCHVFDQQDSDAGRRLHACLHHVYRSTRDTTFWLPQARWSDEPIDPPALLDLLTAPDRIAYDFYGCAPYAG